MQQTGEMQCLRELFSNGPLGVYIYMTAIEKSTKEKELLSFKVINIPQ